MDFLRFPFSKELTITSVTVTVTQCNLPPFIGLVLDHQGQLNLNKFKIFLHGNDIKFNILNNKNKKNSTTS